MAKPQQQILDYSNPPFRKWFVGGETNLCHNAVDRHLPDRANQPALISLSSETGDSGARIYGVVRSLKLHSEETAHCRAVSSIFTVNEDISRVRVPS
jgi:hypothetical protein